MSVESEILRIQHNIANAYATVSQKGGEVPLQPTSANLAAAVSTIPQTAPTPDNNPIGTVISYMGLTAPKDYLICDGSTYNIAEYQALAGHFQQQFGSSNYFGGDGTTTFAVPDMRNLFLRGYHGDAADQLSGDIGLKQEATEVPYFYVNAGRHGGVSAVDNNQADLNIPINIDYGKNQGTKYDAIAFSDVHGLTEEYPEYYAIHPVNMAVLYCIKASESIPVENVYSTEETRIGTWIDGKPLYRIVIIGSTPTGVNAWSTLFTIENAEIVNGDMLVKQGRTGPQYPVPMVLSPSGVVQYRFNGSSVDMYNTSGTYASSEYRFHAEYTKTTDQATISVEEIFPAYLDGLSADDVEALALAAAPSEPENENQEE